jgi:hypothetical protein
MLLYHYISIFITLSSLICLPGNVPCPIVYGAVVDSACLVWEMASGERGACSLYDVDVFRKFYHGKLLHKLCWSVVTASKRLAVHTNLFCNVTYLSVCHFVETCHVRYYDIQQII